MNRTRRFAPAPLALAAILALAIFTLGSPAALAAVPVFGPVSFARTSGPPDVYSDTFTSVSAGLFALWVQNGDDGGHLVTSATVALNGTALVSPGDFAMPRDLLRRAAPLLAGNNTIDVTVDGDAASFITVLILPQGVPPDLTTGRLVLPYAAAADLVLSLKNGSHDSRRQFRLVFFDAGGAAVARSDSLVLAPRASLSQKASTFIAKGSFTEGSLEIYYSGWGPGRLFGEAAIVEPVSQIPGIVPLEQAGTRRLDPADQARRQMH